MSKMPRKWNVWSVSILVLILIGIIARSPSTFVIAIVVLGGIYLLYKYPPSFLKGYSSQQGRTQVKQSHATAAKTKTSRPRSKTVPFRVIEGGKDDDDLPKYH